VIYATELIVSPPHKQHPRVGLRAAQHAPVPPTELEWTAEPAGDGVLSLEQLRRVGRSLASSHRAGPARRWQRSLLRHLGEQARILQGTQPGLAAAVRRGHPAARWLVDNAHVVAQQVRCLRRGLGRRDLRRLPTLADGPRAELPRVYDLACELVTHVDAEVDADRLAAFIGAYQELTHLTLRELWALALMLRLAVMEHLARLALRILERPDPAPGDEHARRALAAEVVSAANGVNGLRALGTVEWKNFVEQQSVVEQALCRDPSRAYPGMTFASRDGCRRVVERLARRSLLDEEQIAQVAVSQAQRAAAGDRQAHVGYFLVDRGRTLLEESIGYRRTPLERLAKLAARAPLAAYLGAIAAVWLAVVAGAAGLLARWSPVETHGIVATGLCLALLAGVAVQFAVSIVNWLCTLVVPPRPMLRMDFSTGIPTAHRTLVAVPTMLSSAAAVRSLLANLELRMLGNRDPNLSFALVTDFPDAAQEQLSGDDAILEMASAGIAQLNRRHRPQGPDAFFLLHRPRLWNAAEGVWMAYERKRGKLAALNQLLLSGDRTAFSRTTGDLSKLTGVRYVITLDTDTSLPPETAADLIGCLAHPLNRPRLDPQSRRVVEGYGILQPRVGTPIPDALASRYSRLMAGEPGIDPYTQQTSDVYHDLFAQGSFIGKGIYDLRAFEEALGDRFPDNRVLSHDLIEGCFARSGLIDDLEVFEGFPARLLADMSRQHRWLRGDWQIAAWLGRTIPAASGKAANPLDGLSRWKIFDNLRRSVQPALLLGLLLAGWTLLPAAAAATTLLALALVFGPPLLSAVPGLIRKPEDKPWTLHLADAVRDLGRGLLREGLALAVLPYRVHCHVDAIARTLHRLCVSGRKLLEWTTASEAEIRSAKNCRAHYELMWSCTLVAVTAAAALALRNPAALLWTAPVLSAWLAGPGLAWWTSQPRAGGVRLGARPEAVFRRVARHTWHFFETYLRAEEHWLPPDHVQQDDAWRIAARTSPTNIGMGLTSELAAYDLGYLSAGRLTRRVRRTLTTLERLERYRGHWFNWYDTRTLATCGQRYISSVDSGNLWGALLVLRHGLEELRDRPLVSPRLGAGLADTLDALRRATAADRAAADNPAVAQALARLEALRAEPFARDAGEALAQLRRWQAAAHTLRAAVQMFTPEVQRWTHVLLRQVSAAARELATLAFWIQAPPTAGQDPAEECAALRELLRPLNTGSRLEQVAQAARAALADHGAARETTFQELRRAAAHALRAIQRQRAQLDALIARCEACCAMDFGCLYDPGRKLLAIGLDLESHRRDESCYDLLASEARLASFLAVSRGQLPLEHWFELGRPMTVAGGPPTLLSWSGSMFEYLMPLLLMPSHPTTVLDSSCRAAVQRQIRYGRRQRLPAWGISESCYNRADAQGTYQYRAFGLPELGMQRDLAAHRVVAPYATALSAMLLPRQSGANLEQLERMNCLSRYGLYDAVDDTPQRRAADGAAAACRSVMSHHSGMALLGLAQALVGPTMPRRFLADPLCRAYDLLLQERRPLALAPVDPQLLQAGSAAAEEESAAEPVAEAASPLPATHTVSNGRYEVRLTSAGHASSRWQGMRLTHGGQRAESRHGSETCYLHDRTSGNTWPAAGETPRRGGAALQAAFLPGRAEFRCIRDGIDSRTIVVVAAEDDVQIRKLRLINLTARSRSLDLTTYADLALEALEPGRPIAAEAGPVRFELLPDSAAILCRRRRRSATEAGPWLFHTVLVEGHSHEDARLETSRPRDPAGDGSRPAAAVFGEAATATASVATVSEPIVSIGQEITLAADEEAIAYVITGVAATRQRAWNQLNRYRDRRLCERAIAQARAWEAVVRRPGE